MLSKNLVALRKKKNLTQEDLASLLQVKRQTYSAYERGVSVPDAYTLQKIASIFDVTTDYLLNYNEAETTTKSEESKPESELTFDDFQYALYGETRELNDNERQELLEVAKFIKQKRKEMQEKGWIPKDE